MEDIIDKLMATGLLKDRDDARKVVEMYLGVGIFSPTERNFIKCRMHVADMKRCLARPFGA